MGPQGINNQNNQSNVVQPAPLPEPGSLEAPENSASPVAQPSVATMVAQKKPATFAIFSKIFKNRLLRTVLAGVAVLTLISLVGGVWWSSKNYDKTSDKSVSDQYNTTNVSLDMQDGGTAEINKNKVSVNGSVKILGEYTLVPSERPQSAVAGQQYIDNKDFRLYVYNGQQWISQLNVADLLALNATITNNLQATNISVTTLQAQTAQIASIPGFTLPGSTTMQGNSFNGAGQLVQLNGSGQVNDSLLSGNVAMLDRNNQVFVGSSQIFRNSSNSTTAFAVQTAASGTVINVNSQDSRVSINKSTAAYPLEVGGSVGIDNTGDAAGIGLYIGGTQVCNVTGCITGAGAGSINNNTSIQTNANFAISGSILDTTNPTARVHQYSGQTTALLQIEDSSANKILTVAGAGSSNPGITIGARPNVSDTNFSAYQPPPPPTESKPNIIHGAYTCSSGACSTTYGTGAYNVTESDIVLPDGWGAPQVVIVTPVASAQSYFRIVSMNANESHIISAPKSETTTAIRSMSGDKFKVGTSIRSDGIKYAFTAIRASSGSVDDYFAYGRYDGNNAATAYVCLNGGTGASVQSSSAGCSGSPSWRPDYVFVLDRGAACASNYPAWSTSTMPVNSTITAYSAPFNDAIKGFGNGYFIVGNNADACSRKKFNNDDAAAQFSWFAMRNLTGHIKIGQFMGNGSTQSVTGVGFKPEYVFGKSESISNSNTCPGVGCADLSISGNTFNGNTWRADTGFGPTGVTSLDNDGFSVGNHDINVNNYNTDYLALKGYSDPSVVNGYSASAVYNGKLYVATKKDYSSSIYRYDGSSWTLISAGNGKITGNESGSIVDSVLSMKVYNNKLFIGTKTSNGSAGLYSYDGSSWTQVNNVLGTIGSTSSIASVSSMAIVNDQLYLSTGKSDSSEIYRYNGGTGVSASFTKISYATAGKIMIGDTATIDSSVIVNYGGKLYAGSKTGSSGLAGLYRYNGGLNGSGDPDWIAVNSSLGTFASTSGIDDITAITTYNGSLVFGTGDSTTPTSAEIYEYTGGPGGGSGTGGTVFTKISDPTAGRIDSTGSARVDRIGALVVYNGILYAGSDNNSATGAIYQFGESRTWTKLGAETEGTFESQAGVAGVLSMIQYNNDLWVGVNQSASAKMYKFSKNSLQSYALKFISSSDGNFDNIGTFSFQSSSQANGNNSNQGQFLISHSLATSAGAYDIAEDYMTSDDTLKPGDVVAIDPDKPTAYVRRADLSRGDGLRLLGIYSTNPAFRLSQKEQYDPAAGSRSVPIALAGRVPVNIDPASEDIKPGDLIAASTKVGYGTKFGGNGYVIAKALESWQKGGDKSNIEVFVTNSFAINGTMPGQDIEAKALADGKVSILDAFVVSLDSGLRLLKNINFVGKVFFENSVEFKDRAFYHDKDFAGYAVIEPGDKKVKVKFVKPYETKPVISVSPRSGAQYHVLEESEEGFIIEVSEPSDKQIQFSWIAIPIREPETYNSKTAADVAH